VVDSSRGNRWAARLGLRPVIRDGRIGFEHSGSQAGSILAIVLMAVADGQWQRLKACPDCRWVFYDHTRNASKRWCLMHAEARTAGPAEPSPSYASTRARTVHRQRGSYPA
jgi:hypothetical protein